MQNNKLQASVRMKLVNKFKHQLEEGSAVTLQCYSLGGIQPKFRIVNNRMRLSFLSNTVVEKCTDFKGSVHGFDFRPFNTITGLRIEEDGQFDVIGQVVACDDLDNYDKNGQSGKKSPHPSLHSLIERSGMENPDGRLASAAQCIKQLRDYKKFIPVKNKGVPDLTMVDFRGITRVPVHGQPEDIYEQISAIITEYITPEESIILNVLSTSVDFSTCESIRMSQRVDVTGQRTLAVARKQTKIMKVFRIITRVPGISRVSKVTYNYNSTTLLMNWKSKVKNKGVADLTMVDFRGITRFPVHGKPEDIYEQISTIITEYITPEESIILNVLSTSVDFSTCESIRMSQRVDVTGQRTLAVARKQTKIMKLAKESYEEARIKEVKLFEAHLHLKWVDKSIVE
ncbi:nucleic acid-binding, OB-fold protein [Tanacetum coccineum]